MSKLSFDLAKGGANSMSRPCYTTIITKLPADRILRRTFPSDKSTCTRIIEAASVENLFDAQRAIAKTS